MVLLLRYIWAAPASGLGLLLALLAGPRSGRTAVVDGVLEVHGGLLSRLLRRGLPFVGSVAAITFGHVILGADGRSLEQSRAHEHVHVRQYERWGPLFIPLYLLVGAVLFFRGRHPYLDNPFEREAYGRQGEEHPCAGGGKA